MPRRRKKATLPRPELNITAMMDLVLNLEMFFVMVSNFALASLPLMTPPTPDDSLAKNSGTPDKVIVNLVPSENNPSLIGKAVLGSEAVPGGEYERVTQLVGNEMKISPGVEIHLRADKSLLYSEVEPYMMAIAAAGVTDVHYVAVTDQGE